MLHDLHGMIGLFFYFNIFSEIWTGFGFGFSFSAVLGLLLQATLATSSTTMVTFVALSGP